jgi:ATPase subunit of ABC transporter with duplicated ATPase domains
VITASHVEVRVGARVLLEDASFRVGSGDRIGLVGRNGAGKTTLTKMLAGEGQPASGTINISGPVGYLPQDPRTGDLDVIARDRVLSARGLDETVRRMRATEQAMGSANPAEHDRAMRRYTNAETAFLAAGGYAAESEAAVIAASLGLPDRVLEQPLGTLSGGQRRRIELARILFGDNEVLLLDEPTNHLDADSIVWLRDYLKNYKGGFVVISHDVKLVESCVNKVFHLDANRSVIDIYNVGWKAYLEQREADERRRKRERANAEKKAEALFAQADKMRAKATKTVAAQNMARRAERLLSGLEGERASDKVAKLRFPKPAPCGKTPLMASGLSKSYGSLEIFTDVDLAVDRGSRVVILGLNGAGKTTLLRLLGGVEKPDTGSVEPGHGLKLGYYAQEHETLDPSGPCWRTCVPRRRTSTWSRCARPSARSCSPGTTWTSRSACCPAARRPGSRWPPSWSPARTCCCSTSRPTTWTRPAVRRSSARSAPTRAPWSSSHTTRARWTPSIRRS